MIDENGILVELHQNRKTVNQVRKIVFIDYKFHLALSFSYAMLSIIFYNNDIISVLLAFFLLAIILSQNIIFGKNLYYVIYLFIMLSHKKLHLEKMKDIHEFQDIYHKYKKIEEKRKTVWIDYENMHWEIQDKLMNLYKNKNYCDSLKMNFDMKKENDLMLQLNINENTQKEKVIKYNKKIMKNVLSSIYTSLWYIVGSFIGSLFLYFYHDLNLIQLLKEQKIIFTLIIIPAIVLFDFGIFATRHSSFDRSLLADKINYWDYAFIIKRIKEDEEQLKLFKQGRLSEIK